LSDDTKDRLSLEDERDFLLRSLDDLESERAAGNIDDGTYEQLHADYTARAAAVLRSLNDAGEAVDVPAPARAKRAPVSRQKRLLTIGVLAIFLLVSLGVLVASLHGRSAGGELTGDNPNATAAKNCAPALEAGVQKAPKSYLAHLALARCYLGTDLSKAVREYDAAAELDPKQPEPLAYGGWIRGLVAAKVKGSTQQLLLKTAFDRFSAAIKLNPRYPDTFVFRGLVRYTVLHDPKNAIPDFQAFLALAPQDHPQRSLVLSALAQAEADVKASTSTTTPTPTTAKP
jgi:cytochrome c-type biogenesis protein CcmH/NrfG